MIIKLLISLCFSTISANQLFTTSSQQMLSLKVPEHFKVAHHQISLLIEQLHVASLVNLGFYTCKEDAICDRLIITDPKPEFNEQIILPASTARIRQYILQHLSRYQQIDNGQTTLENMQNPSEENYDNPEKQKNMRLAATFKRQEDDWERAHVYATKTSSTPKQNRLNEDFIQLKPHKTTVTETPKNKPQVVPEETKEINEIIKWYFLYFILSVVVIVGMKYMHQQEKRINEQGLQFHCPHYQNEEEQL